MNKIISTIKNNKIEILILLTILFETFVLYGNILLFLICSLFSLSLSLFFLYKKDILVKTMKNKLSSYHFFYVLLKNSYDSVPLKSAYSNAAKYLISYQEIIPFEELSAEHNLKLYEFQKYFDFLLKEDQKNELTLKNPSFLLSEVEKRISSIEENEKEIKFQFKKTIILLFFILLILVLFSCFSKMKEIYSLPMYIIPTCLIFPSLYPSILFFEMIQYKRGVLC